MDRELRTQPTYVGESKWFRRVPPAFVVVAAVLFALGNLPGALLFGLPALIAGLAVPWRFAIYADGIELWFCFGKRRALPRDRVTVRANHGGVVVLPRGAQRAGYPLTTGLVDRDRLFVRDVLRFYEFDVIG